MMQLLALETSTEYCSVAVYQNGDLQSQSELAGQRHSELLLEMITRVMNEAGLKLSQLDGIAFGAGPGSFTGVRIACGVAQGLALGADLPVLGVCTLQAVAHVAGRDKVIATIDARMNEVYFAAYQIQSGENKPCEWTTVCEPVLSLPQGTSDVAGSDWFGAGSGFLSHGVALRARYGMQLTGVDATIIPQASAIAQLAAPLFAAGQGQDAALALPLYLRDKVALKISERP
ncbi:MAG: tRNA (adenosine(37)-N6)-threonylcarbamoyltransferase complex dimerization subunit type 1 TsaB [Candidatus Nitrotoga sp.]